MKVRVYWNLHKKCWSVVDLSTGKVVMYCSNVLIKDPEFRVRAGGRARVLEERQKNIHAFVVGELIGADMRDMKPEGIEVTYNPYKYGSFVTKLSEQPVHRANIAYCEHKTVFVA